MLTINNRLFFVAMWSPDNHLNFKRHPSPCHILLEGVMVRSVGAKILAASLAFALAIFLIFSLCSDRTRMQESSSRLVKAIKSPIGDILSRIGPMVESWRQVEQDALLEYAVSRIGGKLNHKQFQEFAYRLRVYKRLLEAHITLRSNVKNAATSPDDFGFDKINLKDEREASSVRLPFENSPYVGAPELLWHLERELFPWAHTRFRSLLEMRERWTGKGILIPTGSGHFRFAVHLVRMLKALDCQLPILLAYGGPKDLKAEEINYINKMGVGFLDVTAEIDGEMLELTGWQIKPFAILTAPFQHVILMDADVVWLQNPAMIFDDPGYLETGAIVFHDRTLFPYDVGKTKWIRANLPTPLSEAVLESRMFRQLSGHEQESGVLAFDKQRHFYGLLAACKMNAKKEREEVTYKEFYGDKESFWLGMEMAGESYTSLQPTAGAIGRSMIDETTGGMAACGRIGQFDRMGRPLWFNGGIVWDKHDPIRRNYLMQFSHFGQEGAWNFTTGCVVNGTVSELNPTEKGHLDLFGGMWRQEVRLNLDPEIDFVTSSGITLPPDEVIQAEKLKAN